MHSNLMPGYNDDAHDDHPGLVSEDSFLELQTAHLEALVLLKNIHDTPTVFLHTRRREIRDWMKENLPHLPSQDWRDALKRECADANVAYV